jgi:hypothetical protein
MFLLVLYLVIPFCKTHAFHVDFLSRSDVYDRRGEGKAGSGRELKEKAEEEDEEKEEEEWFTVEEGRRGDQTNEHLLVNARERNFKGLQKGKTRRIAATTLRCTQPPSSS